LYLSTEWGAIVAVDATEGQLQWAVTYESQPLQTPAALALPRGSPPPCVFDNGRLYVAPTDAPFVFCLDASSGERRWQVSRGRQPAHLLGVAQGRLFVANHSLWAWNADTGQVTWSVRQTEPDDFGYGRGWLAGDHIYWTSRQTAFVIDQRTGQIVREHPLGIANPPRTGGNLVVSNGVLLIAGADRITAYGQFARPLPAQPELLSLRLSPWRVAEGLPSRSFPPDSSQHQRVPLARPVSSTVASRRTNENQTLAEPAAQHFDATVAAVNRDQVIHDFHELSSAGYWRRSWQRALEPGQHVLFPQGDAQSGVVLCQGRELEAWDRHSGQRRWTLPLPQPLLWSAYGTERLLLATTDEVCAVQRDTGRIVWRLPWRATLLRSAVSYPPSTSQVEFHRLPLGLLIVAPSAGFVWYDEQTGAVRKVQQATEPWRVDVSPATSQALVRGKHTGANHFWNFGPGSPQRTPFISFSGIRSVLHNDADGWVYEADDGQLWWCSPTGEATGRFVGTLSHAHADPLVLHVNQTWAILNDGVTLTGLRADETERKWPTWSQALSPVPLRQPREQTLVIGSKIYAAGAGLLRAIDLSTGEREWEQPLPLADPLRVVQWDAHSLAVLPHGAASEPVSRITLFDAASGQPVQQVALTEPARQLSLQSDSTNVLLLIERNLLAFSPNFGAR
jgi:outer membrane protein assembly factor BamB